MAVAFKDAFVPGHSHEAVEGSTLVVEAGAVSVDLGSAMQHDLRTEGIIFHQHPPVVQHLPLTLPAHSLT